MKQTLKEKIQKLLTIEGAAKVSSYTDDNGETFKRTTLTFNPDIADQILSIVLEEIEDNFIVKPCDDPNCGYCRPESEEGLKS